MRVLIVEDDPVMASSIERMLNAENIVTYSTELGEEAIDLAKRYDYDLITLDLKLPDISGLEVLRTLRNAKVGTPIIVLSGNAIVETKVKALGWGADDYVTKPFHKDELIARIGAVVRRARGYAQSIIKTGNLTVNLDIKTAMVASDRLDLTKREYAFIELLSLRKGTTVCKETILDHVYGGIDEPGLQMVDVFVCKLRKKIGAVNAGENYIETIWGRGYMLQDPPPLQPMPVYT